MARRISHNIWTTFEFLSVFTILSWSCITFSTVPVIWRLRLPSISHNSFVLTSSLVVKIYPSLVLLLIQFIYLRNRTFRLILDKLSFTAMNFIRSENNPACSECPMIICGCPLIWLVWAWLLLCMCDRFWEEPILSPEVLKRTLSSIWFRLYLPMFLFNIGLLTLYR